MTVDGVNNYLEAIPYTGCWIWTRAIKNDGYGAVWFGGGLELVHRLMYKLYRGDIPDGMCVLHKCDTRS